MSSATADARSSSTRAEGALAFPPKLPPGAPVGRGVFGSTARTPVWVRCERGTLVLPYIRDVDARCDRAFAQMKPLDAVVKRALVTDW